MLATLTVGPGESFATIGSAVAAASSGDTLLIHDGVYNESLTINKALTLEAVNVGGAIVDGGGANDVVNVRSNTTVIGLHLRNGRFGMEQRDTGAHFVCQRCIVSDVEAAFYINNSVGRSGTAEIVNSLILDSLTGAAINDGGTITVRNSILDNLRYGYVIQNGNAIIADHNLLNNVVDRTSGSVSSDANEIVGDPLFLDRAAGDYRLQSNSPAVDSGNDVGLGFEGDGPDRGPFERDSSIDPIPDIAITGATLVDPTTVEFSYTTSGFSAAAGPILWLDGADPLGNGSSPSGPVSAWVDKSANGHDAGLVVAPPAMPVPTYNPAGLNGLGTISFTPGQALESDFDFGTTFSVGDDYTTFTVFQTDEFHSVLGLIWADRPSDGPTHLVGVNQGGAFVRGYGNKPPIEVSDIRVDDGLGHITTWGFIGGTSVFAVDGLDQPSNANIRNNQDHSSLVFGTRVNSDNATGNNTFYNGDVAEVIFFGGSLTEQQQKDVHAYLGDKWGISVPAGGDAARGRQLVVSSPAADQTVEVGLYRSADEVFDPSDVQVDVNGDGQLDAADFVTVAATSGQASETISLATPMPYDATRPYGLVVADPQMVIDESDETNNVASFEPALPTVTVITHGFQGVFANDNTELPDWILDMARGIVSRAGRGSVYFHDRSFSGESSWMTSPRVVNRADGDEPANSWAWSNTDSIDDEIVLVYDWAWESDDTIGDLGRGWLEAAADNLFASLLNSPANLSFTDDQSLIDIPLHFIGHSRGAILNSEVVRRIASHDDSILVDHFTTLDPHADVVFGDQEPVIFQNVDWADNYWRSDGLIEVVDSDGTPLNGAWNLELDEGVLAGSLPFLFRDSGHTLEHQDVHLWYSATIDRFANELEGENIADEQAAGWWEANVAYDGQIEPGFSRDDVGYAYSRIGGKPRPTTVGGHFDPSLRTDPASLDRPSTVFNGDFNFGGDTGTEIPGWERHGGSGAGHLAETNDNTYLQLDSGDIRRTHNPFFIPVDMEYLHFDFWVDVPKENASLNVYVDSLKIEEIPLQNETAGFVPTAVLLDPDATSQ